MDGDSEKYNALHQRSNTEEEGWSAAGSLEGSLPQMMYGFGDEENPLPETVACMQELVSGFIRHITDEACKAAAVKGRLDTECFMFAARGDHAKYKRAKDILEINAVVKSCTRLRFMEPETTVYYPLFRPPPKVRALASLSSLGIDGPEHPPLLLDSPSSSEASGCPLSSDSEGDSEGEQ